MSGRARFNRSSSLALRGVRTQRTRGHHATPVALWLILCAGGALACSDGGSGPEVKLVALPPTPFIVSNPHASSASFPSSNGVASMPAVEVVYVSLPPGAIPYADQVVIRVRSSGATITAIATDGGLDPVPVAAQPGDTLDVDVRLTSGPSQQFSVVAPGSARPVVVRTSPPPRKRDVPLNMMVTIVFSEPIEATSLNTTSVQLHTGSASVTGTLSFVDATQLTASFTPNGPLAAETDYTLSISQVIRDLDGESMATSVSVPFTTVPAGTSPSPQDAVELVFTVQPTDAGAGLLITPAIQVTARNRLGETATNFAGEVRVTLGANPGGADLIGVSSVTANAGVATFTNLRVSQDGSGYTLAASALGLSASSSKAFDVAPETGQIAFVRSTHRIGHIYLMNTDGSGVTRLTNDVADQAWPAWSPDGAKIAFANSVDGRSQIFVVNADGSGLVRLTRDSLEGYQPTWSPDGSRIVFSRRVVSGSEICVMNADGSDSRVLFPAPAGWDLDNQTPAWSPDGSKIAFLWTNHLWSNIYVMRSDGSGAQPIVVQQNSETDVWAPAWSPDGGHILFWSAWYSPGFTLTTSNGLGPKKVSGNVAARAYARVNWSPHGSRIVFEGATNWAYGSDIYIMKADGSGTVRLTSDGLSSQPAWRPRPE